MKNLLSYESNNMLWDFFNKLPQDMKTKVLLLGTIDLIYKNVPGYKWFIKKLTKEVDV